MFEDPRIAERFEEIKEILVKNMDELGVHMYVDFINDLTEIRYSIKNRTLTEVMEDFDRFELKLNNTLEEISSKVGL